MTETDPETRAIGEIANVITGLAEEQRGRVVRYIVERFNIAGAHLSKRTTAGSGTEQETPNDTNGCIPGPSECAPGSRHGLGHR